MGPLDQLKEMFAGRNPASIDHAFRQAAGDIEAATNIILAEMDEEQSRELLRRPEPAPLTIKAEGPPIQRPPLSPSSSADSFRGLTISDHDVDDWGDFADYGDVPFEHHRPSPAQPQRPHGAVIDGEDEPIQHRSIDECLAGVLTIFPDACPEHIQKLYTENSPLQGGGTIDFIANKLAEGGYPRAEQELKPGLKRKRSEAEEENGKEYESVDRDRAVTSEYLSLVRLLLKQEFPMMPVQYINKVLQQNHNFLASAYAALVEADRTFDSQNPPPYRRLNSPRKILDNNSERAKMGKAWTVITGELEYARNKARQAELKVQMENDAKLAAEMNEKEHEETNMLMECACCFGDYPFDNMTHCNELHFFCLDCARRNAENEVGNGRHKLACMDGSGCKSEFSRREVLRFLDEKTLAALAKIEQEDALRIAEIDGFVTCPFCDYGAICAPAEVDKEFRCLNSECSEVSCRLCQQKSHIPQTCEEFAKENKLSVRHTVEEAMTEAMVRKCNKCAYPYIKEYGCNKIHCNRCNTLQCYICSKTIQNYDHFNDPTRGGKVGNCPLFDNTDQRHEEEIQAAAKKAVEKLREEDPDLTEEDLKIQLSDAVKKAEQARLAQAQGANGGGGGGAPVPNYHIPPYRPGPVAAPYVPPPLPVAAPPARGGALVQRIRNQVRNGLAGQVQALQAQQAQQAARAAAAAVPIANPNPMAFYDPYNFGQVQQAPHLQQRYRGFPRPSPVVAGKLQQPPQLPQSHQGMQQPQQLQQLQQLPNVAQYRGVLHRRPQAPNPAPAYIRQPVPIPNQLDEYGRVQRPMQQAVNAHGASVAQQPPRGR